MNPETDVMGIEYRIQDVRRFSELKKKTFSGYQKSDVLSALQKSIIDQKIEESCHWGIELLVSGMIGELWDKITVLASKMINVANPRMPIYIWNRFVQQIQLMHHRDYEGERVLNLRNNQECRNHLVDVITLLTLSTKNKLPTLPKVALDDFKVDFFMTKLKAKDTRLTDKIIMVGDPTEIHVVANEFAHSIAEMTTNRSQAFYWLNWILEWEKLNQKKHGQFCCATRGRKYIKPQFHRDVMWLIWDIIFQEITIRGDMILKEVIYSLFKIYRYDFKLSSKRRKLWIILHAIMLLTQINNFDKPICSQTHILVQACANVNNLFLDYKRLEHIDRDMLEKKKNLGLVVRNNYLVSSSAPQPAEDKKKKKSKHKVESSSGLQKRLNKIRQIEEIIHKRRNPGKDAIYQNKKKENHDEPMRREYNYKDTESLLGEIQNIIERKK